MIDRDRLIFSLVLTIGLWAMVSFAIALVIGLFYLLTSVFGDYILMFLVAWGGMYYILDEMEPKDD